MKAIIMAGGFGTRLRPLTLNLPKPMVPLLNKPMMEHIVDLLKVHGFRNLTSLLFFQPDAITSYFGNGSLFGVDMKYTRAEADYGTAGSVRNATEQHGIKERILIISGDILTDFDLSAALKFHEEKKAVATIILTRVKNPLQFGVVITEEDGHIARFLEKPSWGEVFSDTINTGIYILEPEAFERIPYRREFDFSKDLFPLLLEEKSGLYGYIADGYWRDIGNLIEYHEAHLDALAGKISLEASGEQRENAVIEKGAEVNGAIFYGKNIIGKNVKISPGATLLNTVIGNDTVIGSGAMLEDAVLWDHVNIGDLAYINHAVICSNSNIGAEAKIHEHVFMGERCQVGEKAEIMPNVKLWPQKQIESGSILHTSLVLEDRWSKALFTNSRISGASNIEVTPEFTAKVGAAFGALVGMGQFVVISRDSDPGSRVISRALTSGLMSAGVNIRDLEQSPIPLTRHDLLNGRQAGGVHVRKNPYEKRRTDMIFFDSDGKDLTTTKGKTIERYFFGEDFPRAPFDKVGTIEFPVRTGEAYRKSFLRSVDSEVISKAKFRIVLDYAFGITSTIFPNILGTLGVEVVSLNGYLEPTKLTRAKEEFKRSTEQLKNIVTSLGYDVGIILDAGGERISVVDENGTFHHNQNLLTLMTKYFLESRKIEDKPVKKIAVPISASEEVESVARQYDVEVVYTKNSHAAMMVASNKTNIGFVGGTRGGFIFPDYFFAVDGMYTATKLLEMMARTKLKIGEISRDLPHREQARRQAFCPQDQLGTVMRRAMEHTKSMHRTLVDGIRFTPMEKNSAWVLIIPEKERPYCEILTDADSKETAEVLAEEYSAQVYEWRKSS
jgi:mannose-1-phosphate guanylyltransferase/phosphomannomutase